MRHIKWPPVLHRPHPDGDLKTRFDLTIIRTEPKPKSRFDFNPTR